MCGIAGIMSFDGPLPAEVDSRLRAAAGSLRHRGPDDEGFFRQGEMGLAFRRLSILDLAGGHQPMTNEDGTIQVVFNGEIYNYRELARSLADRGHRFRTRSDTEVLVHLYEEKGESFVEELRGMFAIALWDSRERRLLLVRDRLGIKPLFYRVDDHEICFASEIKGILALQESLPRRVDEESLVRFLTFFYLPGERTFFQGIRKLPPAHVMECRAGRVSMRRFWALPEADPAPPFDRVGAVERLRELLEESVRLRLISDVPLGAFLSGGIDSSTVVALMQRVSPDPVRTFTIGFEEEESNEIPFARQVARALGTDHHELVVRPEAVKLVDIVLSAFDEPFGDASSIPTYLVSRLARSRVTVALSGDGGDELFAGYTRYRSLVRLARLRRLPSGLRHLASEALSRCLGDRLWALRIAGALRRSLRKFPADYLESVNFLLDPGVSTAIRPEWLEAARSVGWEVPVGEWRDPVDGAQRLDLHHYLPEDILAKVDRMSMACSLEVRVPLLDHKVVEFVASLPPRWKRERGRPKSLLLEAGGQAVPREAWDRPKQGFGIPLARWFRTELREYVCDVLLDDRAQQRGIWNRRGMESLIARHRDGVWDLSEHLWAYLALELWHRKYLDGAERPAGSLTGTEPEFGQAERGLAGGGAR